MKKCKTCGAHHNQLLCPKIMEYHDFKASSEQDYEYEVDNFQNNRDQAFMASIQPDDEYEVDNYLNNSIGLCVCMCVCECDCVSVRWRGGLR